MDKRTRKTIARMIGAVCVVAVAVFAVGQAPGYALPGVEPADLSGIDPATFSDREIENRIPHRLAHLHQVANAVVEEGDLRGFIDLHVWRSPHAPYNARVMENILSLAYFYCADRPWNPYYGDEALRQRLEAALEFWMSIQSEAGAFSEYGQDRWNLPGTAFATTFIGETLHFLEDGPPIDGEVHQRVIQAHRRAFRPSFEGGGWLRQATIFTNQWSAYWPGALAHIDLFDDRELDEQMRYWIDRTSVGGDRAFQSEAGYMTEDRGPAWTYTFGTHMRSVRKAWNYATGGGKNVLTEEDPELMEWLIEEQTLLADWFAYNAVLEPDGATFILNSAIGTRTNDRSFTTRLRCPVFDFQFPMAKTVEGLRPFLPTEEEARQRRDAARAELEAEWPDVGELEVGKGQGYIPHFFEFLDWPERWHPTDAQREEARAQHLPYRASENFTHQRADDRYVFTYARRPPYYAILNLGRRPRRQEAQRLGLVLVWHPQAGTFLQSQKGSNREAWGTRADGAGSVYEARDIAGDAAVFEIDGKPIKPEKGVRDLPEDGADVVVAYPLGGGGDNTKSVTFGSERIAVEIHHSGAFNEHIPLLAGAEDNITVENQTVRVERNSVVMFVEFDGARRVGLEDGDFTKVIVAEATDRLAYTLSFGQKRLVTE